MPRERQDDAQPQLQRRPNSDPAAATSPSASLATLDRRQSDGPQMNRSAASPLSKSATQQNVPSAAASQANAEALAASPSASTIEARDMRRASGGAAPSTLERSASGGAEPSAVATLSTGSSAARAGGQEQPTPRRSGQSIARAAADSAATGDATAASADTAAVRGSEAAGSLAAGATTRREATGQSGLPARGTATGTPTAPTQSSGLAATQLQRSTAADSPQAGSASSRAQLARTTTGGGVPASGAAADGPAEAVAVQGASGGLQSAAIGDGTARAAGTSSFANASRGEARGEPSSAGGVGTAGTANLSRAGGGAAGQPTVASPGSSLRSGKAEGTLDAQAIADAAGDGTGGAPAATEQGGAGLAAQGGGGSGNRAQTSSGALGERNAVGGPAGNASGGVTVGSGNSLARAGGAGNQPQIGSTGRNLTKGTGSLDDGPALSGAAADGPEGVGPATASAGGGGPSARATGRASGGSATAGSAFDRGSAEEVGPAGGSSSSGLGGGPARATADQGGPRVASSGGSLNKATTSSDLPGGADLADAEGPLPGVAAGDDGGAGRLGPAARQPTRGESNSLIVKSQGPEGPGGLTGDLTGQLGVPNRLALSSSDTVQPRPQRFPLNKTGGGLSLDGGKAELPKWAEQRSAAKRKADPGLADSDRAVEAGLDFLARHQSPDGRWSLHHFTEGKDYRLTRNEELLAAGRLRIRDYLYDPMHSDTAATGLALLAFLGAGYTHQEGKYKDEVAAGLQHLMSNQRANGDLYSTKMRRGQELIESNARYVWLYSHGIASIALCEAYGMTRDPALREPAQKAIDFIVAAQSDAGGWRYAPKVDSDTSVSGWQVMALKSAQLAELRVPPECFKKVERWLDSAHPRGDASQYIYRPGSRNAHQNTVSPTMTAEGLLMRLYLGWQTDGGVRALEATVRQLEAERAEAERALASATAEADRARARQRLAELRTALAAETKRLADGRTSNATLNRGADYLLQNMPMYQAGTRDCYYWYYATYLLVHVKGERWTTWNERLKKLLIETQEMQGPLRGSWSPDPAGRTEDAWGRVAGRVYTTAMHVLMLETHYRKLPLYTEEVVGGETKAAAKTP